MAAVGIGARCVNPLWSLSVEQKALIMLSLWLLRGSAAGYVRREEEGEMCCCVITELNAFSVLM